MESCIVTTERDLTVNINDPETSYGFILDMNGQTGTVTGPDCGKPQDPILQTYNDAQAISTNTGWIKYQNETCSANDYDIADAPLVCMTDQFFMGLDPVTQLATNRASQSMIMSAQRVFNNWKTAVTGNPAYPDNEFQETFDKLWPMLYQQVKVLDADTGQMVDNPLAKAQIDRFLIDNPDLNTEPVQNILYNNYTDQNQAYYGFMNASNDCSDYWRWGLNWPAVIDGGTSNWDWTYFYPCDKTGELDYPVNYPKTTFYDTLARLNWGTEQGYHLITDPRTGVLRDPGFIGNPYWPKKTADQARMMAFGILPYNPNDPGKGMGAGKDNPFATVPGYTGKLPQLGKAFNQGNPWVNTPSHTGAGDPTYEDPCDEEGPIQELLPWATALAGVLVPFVILPKTGYSPYVLATTFGYAGYYIAIDSFGTYAVQRKIAGVEYYSNMAASALSLGLPAGLWLAGWDIGVFQDLDVPAFTEWILLPPIALAFDYYFQQSIVDALGETTGLLAIVTYPIALLENVLTYFFSGCVKHIFFDPKSDCKCDDAQKNEGGKTDVRNTLLEYYGVTGDQYSMRGKCIELEQSRGLWKSLDPDYPDEIGKCDTASGTEVNPTACWSAGRWTFGPPDYKKSDVGDRPSPGNEMWGYFDGVGSYGGIWHCLDANNPSFLPPDATENKDLAAKNKQCESQYGEGFRWIDSSNKTYYDPAYPNGVCRNLRLPGPNSVDGSGLQLPGQFEQ